MVFIDFDCLLTFGILSHGLTHVVQAGPELSNPPAFVSWVLGLQACAIIPGYTDFKRILVIICIEKDPSQSVRCKKSTTHSFTEGLQS